MKNVSCDRTWLAYYGNISSCLETLPGNPGNTEKLISSSCLWVKGLLKISVRKKGPATLFLSMATTDTFYFGCASVPLSYTITSALRMFPMNALVSKSQQCRQEGDLKKSRPCHQRIRLLSPSPLPPCSSPLWWAAANQQRPPTLIPCLLPQLPASFRPSNFWEDCKWFVVGCSSDSVLLVGQGCGQLVPGRAP